MKGYSIIALLAAALAAVPVYAQQNVTDDTPVVTVHGDSVARFLEFIAKPKEGDFLVTEAANLRTLADQAGYDGHSAVNLRFVVPAKAVVLGTPGGGVAIDTGIWPDNATVTLIIKGAVYGGGGTGGGGGPMPAATAGGPGGDAIFVRSIISIAVAKGGMVKGGGGGGGGGSSPNGGGGGGGGFPNGLGGAGSTPGSPGRAGNIEWGGRGGNNNQGPANWSTLVQTWSGVPNPYHGSNSGGGDAVATGGGRPVAGGNGGNPATDGYDGSRPGGPAGYAIRVNGFNVKLLTGGSVWGVIR